MLSFCNSGINWSWCGGKSTWIKRTSEMQSFSVEQEIFAHIVGLLYTDTHNERALIHRYKNEPSVQVLSIPKCCTMGFHCVVRWVHVVLFNVCVPHSTRSHFHCCCSSSTRWLHTNFVYDILSEYVRISRPPVIMLFNNWIILRLTCKWLHSSRSQPTRWSVCLWTVSEPYVNRTSAHCLFGYYICHTHRY